ncbi:ABC transporter ATP-binding protein [Nocardioides litoris]|uniref:ABC transporter ATP-binding protein n=1 Tax=Nocardioides litoris TaxID=1926648 RepID=UPI0011234F35|nr:ABC transporter ATP-binding protein [Nocardioides litoris]
MTAGIEVDGLRKQFDQVAALDGVDLEVGRGEVVTLLGQNGAGKSTLLRILGTTVLPDAGTARVAGHDVVLDRRRATRSLGLVLGEERSWYWRLTGRQNLEFFAALHGLRRRTARARAAELLERTQLADAADRAFSGYSSGMRARLSLARALLVEPSVLLLDEPSRTLDPIVARDFRTVVTAGAREGGAAVLWVTHDLHEAAEVSDRMVILHRGTVVEHLPGTTSAATAEQRMLAALGAGR